MRGSGSGFLRGSGRAAGRNRHDPPLARLGCPAASWLLGLPATGRKAGRVGNERASMLLLAGVPVRLLGRREAGLVLLMLLPAVWFCHCTPGSRWPGDRITLPSCRPPAIGPTGWGGNNRRVDPPRAGVGDRGYGGNRPSTICRGPAMLLERCLASRAMPRWTEHDRGLHLGVHRLGLPGTCGWSAGLAFLADGIAVGWLRGATYRPRSDRGGAPLDADAGDHHRGVAPGRPASDRPVAPPGRPHRDHPG
jgi:hypothetical protein